MRLCFACGLPVCVQCSGLYTRQPHDGSVRPGLGVVKKTVWIAWTEPIYRADKPPVFSTFLKEDGTWGESMTFAMLFKTREEAEAAAFVRGCKMPQEVRVSCFVATWRDDDDAPPVPMYFEALPNE